MASIVFLVGAVTALAGSFLLLDTSKLRTIVEWISEDGRLLRVSLLRGLLAIAFYFAAEQTRLPAVTLALAGVFLLSAIAVPLLGEKFAHTLINWWLARMNWLALPWCVIAICFGVLLMWLAWPTESLLNAG
jgi:hypothetical protein